jgi:hypothetical protein
MGPNRVGVSLSSPEDENRSNFLSVMFSSYLELEKSIKPVILSVVQNRQNALDCNCIGFGHLPKDPHTYELQNVCPVPQHMAL